VCSAPLEALVSSGRSISVQTNWSIDCVLFEGSKSSLLPLQVLVSSLGPQHVITMRLHALLV
jgi:hypothetical protein